MTTSGKRLIFGRYDYAVFLTYIFYAGSSVIVPLMLVQIAESLHFPLQNGGQGAGGALQIGRSIPMVAAMLFSGFAAARWGNRHSIGFSLLLIIIGITGASLAPGYGVLFFALTIAGLGEGVIEGLATPYIQEMHPDAPGRYINFGHGFWSVGLFATAIAVGILLTVHISWRLLLGFCGLATIFPALLLLLPSRQPRPYAERRKATPSRVVWMRAGKILREPRFWLFFAAIFLAGGGEFGLTFWSASFIILELGGTPLDGGIGITCFAAGMMLGRLGSGILVPQQHLLRLVLGAAVLAIGVSLCFPVVESRSVAFALLFFGGLGSAPFWPSIQSYATIRMKHLDSTMIFILLSCSGVPGSGFFSYLMGVIGDACGLRKAFYVISGCLIGMALLLLAEARRPVARQRGGR